METVMCLSWPPVIESLKTHVSTKWKHGLSVYGYYFWYVWNVGFPLIRIQYTLVPGEGEHVVINTGSWGVPAQQSPLGCNVQCSELHWHVHSCEEQRITDRQFEISSAKVIGSSLIFTFFFSLPCANDIRRQFKNRAPRQLGTNLLWLSGWRRSQFP